MKMQMLVSIITKAVCVTFLAASAISEVQTATYRQASDICAASEASLASLEQLRHQLQLVSNDVSFWLPYVKSTSGDWRWTDGTFYATYIINPAGSVPHQDCAVIQSRDKILDESYCFKPSKDFLCDLPGLCPTDQTCISVDNKNRSVHYRKFSWFTARGVCRKLGGDLATFRGNNMQPTIQSIQALLKRQGHFWIGLARKQWLTGEHEVYYNWTSNADDSLGCATISHDLAWRTARCENQNAFICNITKTEESTMTEQTTVQKTAAGKTPSWETTVHTNNVDKFDIRPSTAAAGSVDGGIVAAILLSIIVALVVCFFVFRYFQVKRRQELPESYRETLKKMVFFDKLCQKRDISKAVEVEQGVMDKQKVTSTNKKPQDIKEPSALQPLLTTCREDHTRDEANTEKMNLKLNAQEFKDLLRKYSAKKGQLLAFYAASPDVFHQNIDAITSLLSYSTYRPGLLLLLQKIAECSPQVFLERHVSCVGSYISKDSGEYPVLTVLNYFPTKFPGIFEKLDDALIKHFKNDGERLFKQFPRLIGLVGCRSKKHAKKYTEFLVNQAAVLPLLYKNTLLACLTDIATHFKSVVLVYKDKIENINHPILEPNMNKLLRVLDVKNDSPTSRKESTNLIDNEEEKNTRQVHEEGNVQKREQIREKEEKREQEILRKVKGEQKEVRDGPEVNRKQEERKDLRPNVSASATRKGPTAMPPADTTKTAPARPPYPPGQIPHSTGDTDKQPAVTSTSQSSASH